MADKIYLPMRTTAPVSCEAARRRSKGFARRAETARTAAGKGTSDAIPVNAGDFRAALDAALRLARSFDDGVSECGLACDGSILALDDSNRGMLPAGAKPLSTRFPCG